MRIDSNLIFDATAIRVSEDFACDNLAMANSVFPNSLTFLDDKSFLAQINSNSNISAVLVTADLGTQLDPRITSLVVDDPRYHFFTLLNHVARTSYRSAPTKIDPAARIHETAWVSDHNVEIGRDTVIEPNVTVLSDVTIGDRCIIRAGAIIGSEGFEHKRTSRGILSVLHDGTVEMGNDVEIGANSCVDKGFSFRTTIIGDETKIDNFVHVGHGVQTGKRCLFAACSMVGGSVTYGDDVWVGPNSTIRSGISVGSKAYITMGSVVTKNVGEGETVTGNWAVSHDRFLDAFKKTYR